MKKSNSTHKNKKTNKKISPEQLSDISGGNRILEGFERMVPDVQNIIDALIKKRNG